MARSPLEPLGFAALPGELRARIEAELSPGERLLWASAAGPKPETALLDPAKPLLAGVFALTIGSLLLWYTRDRVARPNHAPGLLAGSGLVAVVASLFAFLIMLGAWRQRRVNRRSDRRAAYALTDRRVLFWEPKDRAGGVEVISIDPQSVQSVHRLEYPDGSGEVRISFVAENRDFGTWLPRSLIGIADVRLVETLTRSVLIGPGPQQAAARRPAPNSLDYLHDPDEPEEPF